MIHDLLNTLYVQTQGAYLRLDHETVRVEQAGADLARVPLHHLGSLALFGNVLVSPFLLHRCAEDNRSVSWFTMNGRFAGRLNSPTSGNVLLRLAQHDAFSTDAHRLQLARTFVAGKIRNSRVTLLRSARDNPSGGSINDEEAALDALLDRLRDVRNVDQTMGVEGSAASTYFAAFPRMLRNEEFVFGERNRRPPRDPVNALLSFAYALLANECASALEGVGLDPQIGFLHAPRPGRASLALDLMEEFRAPVADRAILTLLNRKQLRATDFEVTPGGAVRLLDGGRRTFLKHWQERKQEPVEHQVLSRTVPRGLLPHIQARLLARHLRGDIPEYPPFQAR